MALEFGAWLLRIETTANESLLIKTGEQDFEKWFVTNGGYFHPHIVIKEDPGAGKSLRVKPDQIVPPDSTLVSCPHHLSLSWPSARKFHFPQVQNPLCSQHVATRFFLMKQRLLGVNSPWWPYIAMLPLSFNTPLYYDPADMVWIRGTNLGRAKKVREDAWHAEYQEGIKLLFPDEIDGKHKRSWTWELYVWAATIITSRSFPGPTVFNRPESDFSSYTDNVEGKEPVLIPGLDLLNHNPSSHVAWIWDSTACTIKTDEPLFGGGEVPNNYGPKSNEELIMGYGFSLPDNPADHFSISFAPAIAASVKSTREHRLGQKPTDQKNNIESCSEVDEEYNIHWVRTYEERLEFSPNFLEEISIAVENPREHRDANGSPRLDFNLLTSQISRNKLHVLCAVLMIMQKGYTAISEHNSDLPEYPQNTRQADAARYRHGQLHVLERGLEVSRQILSSLLNKETANSQSFRIMRLEDILTECPRWLEKDFRSVLNAGLKTRDPTKIRERGGTDFAFTVWLYGLTLHHHTIMHESKRLPTPETTFDGRCLLWLEFLREAYPEEDSESLRPADYSSAVLEADRAAWFDPVRSTTSNEGNVADPASTVDSYLDAIQVCVEKHPQSLYGDAELSTKHLMWCYNVIRNEGVWIPDLQEKDGDDEWMLFIRYQDQ